ncbi:dCTP deaminase domain-containing protein [Nitratidesulfovibrio vulgaris]|uniref:dCTP deaminase domain-containing protein n=1 Tax=Nitratidesulfovibrio vulgaris TaxID=881 RepID=UPI0023006359|nr:hypothetical protein [Nitratidesulfovibrio vulgaris]WCB46972.1 hypothetical protein PH214_02520 [Nitratidesulfovibrio vulgaris]
MLGTLTDSEIIGYCEQHELIVEGYSRDRVKQACYELCASNTYYDIYNNSRRISLESGQYILIKPKQCVVIITEERLELPNDILGRILTKGKLFSIGISAVNTYADPGFQGKIGIVLINLSNSYIKIQQQQAIAKIEFSKLERPVTRPYSGQHGYETEIWPVPIDMILTNEEIQNDNRIYNELEELKMTHGETLAGYMKTVFAYERYLLSFSFASAAVIFLCILYLYSTKVDVLFLDQLISIIIGLATSIMATIVINVATRKQK